MAEILTLKELNTIFKYCIVDGSKFLWSCYGHHARTLDYEADYWNAMVVFDTETQVVYEASIYLDNLTFRWISPLWKDKLLAESLNRGVDSKKAYDDVSFNDISAECFLLVSNDIVNNAANQ